MKVEILHVPGCPHALPAVELVQEVLRSEGLAAEIKSVLVTRPHSPLWERFAGSPTILVNGQDVEPDAPPAAGSSCRLYANRQSPGLPRRESVVDSVRRARAAEAGARPAVAEPTWDAKLPRAAYADGPVWRVQAAFRVKLKEALDGSVQRE